MDISTIIGISAGLFFIVYSILLGGDIGGFLDIPSVIIVFGGTIASTMINFPLSRLTAVAKVVRKAFFHKDESLVEVVDLMVSLAEKARREGILAIEKSINDLEDPFMKTGLQLAVDGSEPDTIRSILDNELNNLQNRHKEGQSVVHALGLYAPAYGMIGTLIGLIQMLRTMEDPSTIGAGMAVAIVTTFYGAVLANLVFGPMEGKLKLRSAVEVIKREMIIEGILAIQSGDNPRIVRGKLMTFIAPKDRAIEEK